MQPYREDSLHIWDAYWYLLKQLKVGMSYNTTYYLIYVQLLILNNHSFVEVASHRYLMSSQRSMPTHILASLWCNKDWDECNISLMITKQHPPLQLHMQYFQRITTQIYGDKQLQIIENFWMIRLKSKPTCEEFKKCQTSTPRVVMLSHKQSKLSSLQPKVISSDLDFLLY